MQTSIDKGRATRSARRSAPFKPSSILVPAVLFVFAIYFLLPCYWLVVSATKSTPDFFSTFGLWFAPHFNFFTNVQNLLTYNGGLYTTWLWNSFFYASVSAVLGTLFSSMAGYALTKFVFPGRNLIFSLILGAVLVPAPALVLPLYLLMSGVHLTDTIWAIILPSIVNPFGVYLARIYAEASVPDTLLDASRVDGAGEFRIFFTIVMRILSPALVTIFLFQFVAVWTNFFLQYVMVSNPALYPVTVGLQTWNTTYTSGGAGGVQFVYSLILTGALLSIVPLVIGFLLLQRYWRNGLTLGSLAN
ncbi:carbohydrate ABC transporter permease [Tengunoibacter tsumagoiensis]|uniref:Sugar ABC transporter permease n=1 Tax=Tengunoibacter tsumagoiensis TaxID=2014871 RepID=A0A401ZZ95_9CHLR|nr:carbohydrate ABC transporter permease [Tengunoibacter tsumagoiensis]GCE12175.1 sugar ABC transporter permease [Tengunoibacter tsumagoiensis]